MDRYSIEQQGKIRHLLTEWERTGRPELIPQLMNQIEAGVDFDMLFPFVHQAEEPTVRPTVDLPPTDAITMPPREGQKATKKAWSTFASKVTDVDPTVWDSMSRNEIISVLEDMNVIDSLDIEQ